MFPIDGHVHFHSRARIERTMNAAVKNFQSAGAAPPDGMIGGLILAESAGEQVFQWLREQTRVGVWAVEKVEAERHSVWLTTGAGRVLVVCGRQIQAERGLEILALGTEQRFEERLGLEPTLDHVRASGALAVLPWGFGKWLGSRGDRIRSLIAAHSRDDLWLGDNGGRLRALRRPSLLEEGERRGLRILPGSDPFPFGRDYRRVGSFGFLLPSAVDAPRPWQSIATGLRELRSSPPAYGNGTGWLRFGLNQTWIQLHMRLHRGRSA